MKFSSTTTTKDYPITRLVSENKVWEVGIYKVIPGVRVAAGKIGSNIYAFEYCCANNYNFAGILLTLVTTVLESFPETLTSQEASKVFPVCEIKPAYEDQECWNSLLKLLEFAAKKK